MSEDPTPNQNESLNQRLRELAVVFFRLGATAFGGPAAHIAMMDDEVVKRRQWLDRQQLLDLMGATSLIPGPNSTELAIHIGYERAKWPGLVVAGSCFILPAMAIVWGLAIDYEQYQTVPEVEWLLYGIKPVIIAVVAQALLKLGQKAIKTKATGVIALLVVTAFVAGLNEILLLVLAGLGSILVLNFNTPQDPEATPLLLPLPWMGLASVSAGAGFTAQWHQVFFIFLRIGSVLYGSGYVLLAFLEKELVERMEWLSADQLLDAIAIGQLTPGPVFTTATFVGYLLAGHAGAIAATIGIFLPAFALVGLINPWVSRLRSSPGAGAFLDGVNAASLALMAVVTVKLGLDALVDPLTVGMATLSFGLLWYFSVNSAWLVLGGGFLGWLIQNFS